MKQPVDHILRPQLPWRSEPGITECGLDATKVVVLTRAEYLDRKKDMGMQRSAMLTCMTCSNTASRWDAWENDPRKALGREIEWETGWSRNERGEQLRDELLAIEALINAHPDEFAAERDQIRHRRDWRAKKAAFQRDRSKPDRG